VLPEWRTSGHYRQIVHREVRRASGYRRASDPGHDLIRTALQRQEPAVLSLDTFTHLMAAGAPRSGRSQLLRTIAGALALAHSCADVHLYGIDCGNGALTEVITRILSVSASAGVHLVMTAEPGERRDQVIKHLAGQVKISTHRRPLSRLRDQIITQDS
jgi:hypothetical protein